MEIFPYLLGLVFVLLVLRLVVRPFTVVEYERAVVYRRGRFVEVAEPGVQWRVVPTTKIRMIDIRRRSKTIPGQELLTSDGIGLKTTLIFDYEISDPYVAITKVEDLETALYAGAQIALRDIVGSRSINELLEQRNQLGPALLESVRDYAAELGVTAHRLEIKDVMLPGDLKRIFGQVAEAKQEALASLERARATAASMRSLTNTATLMKNNPELLQLRLLDAIQSSAGNTFVVGPSLPAGAWQPES